MDEKFIDNCMDISNNLGTQRVDLEFRALMLYKLK